MLMVFANIYILIGSNSNNVWFSIGCLSVAKIVHISVDSSDLSMFLLESGQFSCETDFK